MTYQYLEKYEAFTHNTPQYLKMAQNNNHAATAIF